MRRAALVLQSSFMVCTFLSSQTHTFTGGVDTAWVRHYGSGLVARSASAMAVDVGGNVYVTGSSFGSYTYSDYATIKYTSSGDVIWVRHQNGPGDGEDYATALAVDASGNVYVTGATNIFAHKTPWGFFVESVTTTKLDVLGSVQWTRQFGGFDFYEDIPDLPIFLKVDDFGNTYVAGQSGSYCLMVKYSPYGDTIWTRPYIEGFWSEPRGVAADAEGNVYLAVTSVIMGSPYDTLRSTAVKYDLHGSTIWKKALPGLSSGNIAIGDSGDTYYATTANDDHAIVKFDRCGNSVWLRKYSDAGSYRPTALAEDMRGNIFVTGTHIGTDYATENIVTLKYNAGGDLLWEKKERRIGSEQHYALLSVDRSGNAYVVGDTDSSMLALKYKSDGSEEWKARYSSGSESARQPIGIGLDSTGSVYIAGTSQVGEEFYYTVIKYVQTPTTAREGQESVPTTFTLDLNYPNPFNPATVISYHVPLASRVSLTVFDLLGREVAVLVDEEIPAGYHMAQWDASGMPSGAYFCRMRAGEFVQVRRLMLIK